MSPKRALKTLATALMVLVLSGACTAQQHDMAADSTLFAADLWQRDTLQGFYFYQRHFGQGELFGAAQHIFVVDIPASSKRKLAFVADSAAREVSAFATQSEAFASINGSFFDMQTHLPICFLRIDGHQWGENTPQASDTINRKYYQYATIVLRNGRPQLLTPDSNRLWENALTDSNVMTAGPMLLTDGAIVPQRSDRTFAANRHNRTALGLRDDGSMVLLVADGRWRNVAEGLTLTELAHVMRWLGCRNAINLDGGGSSTMWVDGQCETGVVNYPTDNNVHDHTGERPVSNAIIVR